MKNLRALVIDDSRVMRIMVMRTLKQANLAEFEFEEAGDGKEGLAKFNPRTTDIVFVDWNMPQMSGLDLVRRLRHHDKNEHVPIVMVTSEKTVGKVEAALEKAGADAYISKPFTAELVHRRLEKVIAGIDLEAKSAAGGGGGLLGRLLGN